MSATEWKFVPVEPTANMESVGCQGYMDADGMIGIMHNSSMGHAYRAMLDAAPVPPSVESLLENWTPSDQQAFAKFRDEHFPGEMSSYAIQSLGSAWKDGQANSALSAEKICRTDGRCEYAIQAGIEGLAQCQAGKCSMPQPAHLTIPGALEWDGDNGTHGVVGTHSADGESRVHGDSRVAVRDAIAETLGDAYDCTRVWSAWQVGTMDQNDFSLIVEDDSRLDELAEAAIQAYDNSEVICLRAQLANTEQSRRSFFDLSQDLEKRLAERDALLAKIRAKLAEDWLDRYAGLDETREEIDIALSDIADPAKCESCGGWGHIETEDSAHDCPECGPSVVERAVEAGVMNAPKPYAAMTEAEADEFLSSFGGGSGNKAKRRIAAIEKAKLESFPCWSCREPVTTEERAAADGSCPHCAAELDLEDWPRAKGGKGGEQ